MIMRSSPGSVSSWRRVLMRPLLSGRLSKPLRDPSELLLCGVWNPANGDLSDGASAAAYGPLCRSRRLMAGQGLRVTEHINVYRKWVLNGGVESWSALAPARKSRPEGW